MTSAAEICYFSNECHPETESKDPYPLSDRPVEASNFGVIAGMHAIRGASGDQ
jgi:hypothetical protein